MEHDVNTFVNIKTTNELYSEKKKERLPTGYLVIFPPPRIVMKFTISIIYKEIYANELI